MTAFGLFPLLKRRKFIFIFLHQLFFTPPVRTIFQTSENTLPAVKLEALLISLCLAREVASIVRVWDLLLKQKTPKEVHILYSNDEIHS